MTDFLATARQQVLDDGRGLNHDQALACLRLPDDALTDLLALAHDVRLRWCGPEVEVEGIVSVKTGGCPEDCHFCSQSGQFDSPVRAAWLDIPSLVAAAEETAATGATEFCIVAAVRGPDERLMRQVRDGVAAINAAVDINIACSLGMLTQAQVDELAALGVHRYNHNLETARSYFPSIVTTHTWEERWETLRMVREAGMEVCCGGILGLGETLEQRVEFAMQLAELEPHEVPLNFLNPRPGTPLADAPLLSGTDALRAIAMFRLALPRTILRYAGGRELTLGDLDVAGMLGGINAVIVGNYLTTLGRPAEKDLAMLTDLGMPLKALSPDFVVLIRAAAEADVERVAEVTFEAYVGDDLMPADSPYVAELTDAVKRLADGELIVAEIDGVVAGAVTFAAAGTPYAEKAGVDEAEIRMLAVAKASRGQGVGLALVQRCIARALELGARTIRLSTQEDMHAAHRLYERLGFVRTPELDWRPVPDVPLLTFALDLQAYDDGATELEPPRRCSICGRRMVVQVTPTGWTARCSEHGVRTR